MWIAAELNDNAGGPNTSKTLGFEAAGQAWGITMVTDLFYASPNICQTV